MATATAPALKSVEVFKDGVSLFRWDSGANPIAYPFVVVCADGAVLWGQQLPEMTDRQGEAIGLPEIQADKVIVTGVGGVIEELNCGAPPARAEGLRQ